MIDDKAPAITASLVTPQKYTDNSGVKWFKQSDSGEIEIDATITDLGSGVVPTSVKLMNGSTRIDDPATKTNSGSSYRLFIPRTGNAPLIPANSQGIVSFTVVASDGVGNTTFLAGPSIGIDGEAPVVSLGFAGQYPSSGTNCNVAAPSGVTSSLVCGHDGSRFTRTGDDGSTLFFTVSDGSGSGKAQTGATCAVYGQPSCSASYNSSNSHYEFVINPSQVNFTSDADGRGTTLVSVSALDAVGNQGVAVASVNITRLKWIRTLPTSYGSLRAPMVVTPVIGSPNGKRLLLVAGTGSASPVAALDTNGGFLTSGTVGTAGAGSVELAYSASTQTLYATQERSTSLTAFTAASAGLASSYSCKVSSSASLTGPAAIIGSGANERAIVADSYSGEVFALTGSGGACNTAGILHTSAISVGTGELTVSSSLGYPTTDGANVYAAVVDVYNNNVNPMIVTAPDVFSAGSSNTTSAGWSKASFSVAAGFSSPATQTLSATAGANGLVGGPELVGANLFQAISTSYGSFPTNFTASPYANQWSGSSAGVMADTITFSPVINGGVVYGVAGSNDGSLRVFNSSTGAPVFTDATGAANSQVALGGEAAPVIYFTDSNGNLHAVVQSGSTVANAANWSTAFTGATTGATFTGVSNEPTLAADGTLYFGTQSAQVFAIATDSPGTATPSTSNWPRVQFDNCNSGNTSLTCP